ncbi:zinc finger protein 710-like [Macrosteles quadrilineatus]|uniref:zinc finger protein 710-like n=1 Tax=Macrosteles quadrilineatus TaxID=74068 RepID=UPI0023E321CF|nr:zinc finger protein 710-like [Macrosteles quadrilineatus]
MPDSAENNVACRICMNPKDQYVSLFFNDLSRKVMELADVQVEKEDGLPENICAECEKELEKCYEFRLKVQVADKKFRKCLGLKFAQVDLEEHKIKEENYINEDSSDNEDDTHSVCMDEENEHEPEDSQRISEETEEATPDPLNHVQVVQENEKAVEMAEDPIAHTDLMVKQPQITLPKIEEVSVDQFACMKQESEVDIMDIDCNQPDPFGPSSSVRSVQRQKPMSILMSTSTEEAQTKNQKEPIRRSSRTSTRDQQIGFAGNQKVLSDLSLQGSKADGKPTKENKEETDQGFVLIPHQLGFDAGLLVPFTDDPNSPASKNDANLVGKKNRGPRNLEDKPVKEPISTKSLKSSSPPQSSNAEVEAEEECFCPVCNIDFGFPDILDEHKKGKEFICRSCTTIFNNHEELEAHFVSHRKFICKVCKKVFHVKSDLIRHKGTVQGCKRPEMLKCKYCHNRFVHESNLESHMKTKHPNAESRPFACNICNSSFKIRGTFRDHLKACHTVYESMECDICHKILPGPSSLKTHVKSTHIQSVSEVCEICNKVMASKTAFKLHMETHNGEEKVCYICGAVIKGKTTFKQHIYYHENRRHSCSFCNIVFNTLLEKNRHYREKHVAPKPAICEICGKEFKAREILKNHMMTHSDEKPYVCSLCGAAFKSKTVLKTHSRVHSDLRKYSCKNCGEAFRWKQTFDKHIVKCGSSQNEAGTRIN